MDSRGLVHHDHFLVQSSNAGYAHEPEGDHQLCPAPTDHGRWQDTPVLCDVFRTDLNAYTVGLSRIHLRGELLAGPVYRGDPEAKDIGIHRGVLRLPFLLFQEERRSFEIRPDPLRIPVFSGPGLHLSLFWHLPRSSGIGIF